VISLWRLGLGESAEKIRRRMAAGEYGGRPVAERWADLVHERYVITSWLAGKGKPPRIAPERVPVHQGDQTDRREDDSWSPSDKRAGKISATAKKIVGSMRPGHRSADDEEHPAADNR